MRIGILGVLLELGAPPHQWDKQVLIPFTNIEECTRAAHAILSEGGKPASATCVILSPSELKGMEFGTKKDTTP